MAARYEIHIGTNGLGGNAPLPGGDHFAPQYLVGNVPAGDPAVAQTGAFRYIPDPGDGSGIALAITEAIANRGDVWIRRGAYVYTGATRMVVPSYCRVRGAGSGVTYITSSITDNCVFELAVGAAVIDMTLIHSGTVAAAGVALIETQGPGIEVANVTLDLQLVAPGGLLTAGVLLSGNAVNRIVSRLDRMTILLPDGVGGTTVTAWLAGIRGAAVVSNQHIAHLSDIFIDRGDVGVLTLGVEMQLEGCISARPRRMGLYSSVGRLSARGRPSQVVLSRVGAGELAGCQLIASVFALDGVQFSTTNVAARPAIYVSGGAGTAVADIGDWEIGTGFSPAMQIGNAAEVVNDARIHDNVITLAAGIVPVALGTGASNANVIGNVSRGSGGVLPTDLGTGSNILGNIWGA